MSLLALEPRWVFDGAAAVTAELNDPAPLADADLTAQNTSHSTAATVDISASVLSARQELVVVDGALPDLQTLLDDIRAADPNRTVLVLDPNADEIDQLTQYLLQHEGQFDALHLMTHGGKGWIDFAGQAVSLGDPAQNATLWTGISNGLRAGGDLLLYGCNVAETSVMADMVRSLSLQLGIGIAASKDSTGMNGNWSLEFQTGSIEALAIAAPHWRDDLTVALAVSSISVNEASPYAVFLVKGNANQSVSLSLSGTATGGGVDYGPTLEWTTNGTTWTTYTSGTINLSAGDGEAFVRLPIVNDTPSDNGETIILTVTPTTGSAATGVATIRDDGTGSTYSGELAEPPLDASTLSAGDWHDLNFSKSRLMIASFHGAFYKASTGGYYVAGELASPTSTNLTTPKLVTPAEGYTYTGDIIDVVVAGGNAVSQYAVLTTEGLWVWGSKNTMLPTALTPSSFSKITLPADFSPRDALTMTATDGGLVILMRDGTVRTVVIDTRASGHTDGDHFAQVRLTSATGPVLTGITDVEYSMNTAFAYSKSNNTFYTWGLNTLVGDGTIGFTSRPYAAAMANPLPAGVDVIQIGVTKATYFVLGSNGRIYTVGQNNTGAGGQGNTTTIWAWTTVKNTEGTGPLENVQFISTQNGGGNYASISAILEDGSLLAWGENNAGMIAIGVSQSTLPKVVQGSVNGEPMFAVENGGHFSLALNYGCDGEINATGHNPGGAFGDGTTVDRSTYGVNLFLGNIAGACEAPVGTSVLGSPSADDDRTIAVNNLTVNEGSAYAVFTVPVNAPAGTSVTLSLGSGTASGSGTDYGAASTVTTVGQSNLEFSLDGGTTWLRYTTSFEHTLSGAGASSGLLVRTMIINDTTPDNNETFQLTASIGGSALTATGTATIKDDGTGDIFTASGSVDANAVRDGDFPLSVNSLVVNEGTPYAVWTVKYVAGQTVTLDLVYDSTAVAADLNASAAPMLQYYNGTTWVNYTPGSGTAVSIPTGGKLLVRTTVENDVPYEVSEVLSLKVVDANATVGTVRDIPEITTMDVNVVANAAALDLSRNLILNSDFAQVTRNVVGAPWGRYRPDLAAWIETGGGTGTYADAWSGGSSDSLHNAFYFGNYYGWLTSQYGAGLPPFNADGVYVGTLTFSNQVSNLYGDNNSPVAITQNISTEVGQKYRLQFRQESEYNFGVNDGLAAVDVGGQRIFFKVNSAVDKVYTFEFVATASTTPLSFMSWGHLGLGPTTANYRDELVLVQPIINKVESATGTLTILDNGQGDLFSSANVTGTADAPGTATSGGTLTLNDDRGNNPVVNDVTVNEGSPYAVFTVDGLPGAKVDLTMSTAGGPGAADLIADLSGWEWSNDGGQTWSSTLIGAPLHATTGQMLVRFVPTNDDTLETSEAFTLKAQYSATQTVAGVNSNTATNFDTGIGTIKDDGTGQWFTGTGANAGTGSNSAPAGSALNDDRGLAVSSVTANEASPYMVFEVTGTVGQLVSLALDTTGTGAGHADLTADLQNAGTGVPLQVYNGTAWVNYTPGSFVAIPAGNGGTMLVRTKLVNDTSDEGTETYLLTASNVDATLKNAATASGTGTILDNGTGDLFSSTNTTGTPEAPGTNSLPSVLNNDQPITVNNISVNEGSPYGVFTLGGTAGRSITLALANGTATGTGTDYGSAADTNLQYSLNGGADWVNYTGAFTATLTGADLLVRTPIVNDNVYDNGETFTLTATPAGGNEVVGTATIHDDGTGQWFSGTSGVGNNSAPAGQYLDGDMPLSVNSLTVNEGTPYAVWTVVYGAGKQVSLGLSDGTAGVASDLLTYAGGHQMETSVDGGANWTLYVAGSSTTMGADSKLLVRVRVNNDTPYEVSEVLNLTVVKATAGTVSDITGTATPNVDFVANAATLDASASANLVRNGLFIPQGGSQVGVMWSVNYAPQGDKIPYWTASGGGSASYAAAIPPGNVPVAFSTVGIYFGNGVFSQTNPIVFDANGAIAGDYTFTLDPTFGNNASPVAIQQSIPTEVGQTYRLQFTQGYEVGSNYAPGMAAVEIGDQRIYFRVNYANTVYTFQFTATDAYTPIKFMNWGHATVNWNSVTELALNNVIVNKLDSVTGTLTILDNNQGSYFSGTRATPDATPPALNDDRANNPVVNDVTVNEGSPYGVFTVNGLPGAKVDLSATAGSASLSDFSSLAWSNDGGATWSTVLTGATLDSNGALLARFIPVNDANYEGSEAFTLTATYSATQAPGVVVTTGASDTGTGTLKDDGTGQWFTGTGANAWTGSATAPAGSSLNDDRVISVNSIGVNEASPYAVFTVTATAGQTVSSLALAAGTATGGGTDYGSGSTPADNLQYSLDGGQNWVTYTAGASFAVPLKDATGATVATGAPTGAFLVRTKIINDAPFDSGETFTLTAALSSGHSSTGTSTIFDDGTGTVFNNDGTVNSAASKNDDRGANPVVNSVTVNEGSPCIVFTVEGKPGAKLDLLLTAGTAAGGTTTPSDGTVDYNTSLEYFDGTAWQPYAAGVVIPANTGGKLFVRSAVVNDASNEGAQSFTLKATYSATQPAGITVTTGANATGTGTIADNGTGTLYTSANPAPGILNGNSVWLPETITPASGSEVLAADANRLPNDDRPLSITGFTVNEASPYGIFKVNGASGQYVKLLAADGTAVGGSTSPADGSVDYSNTLEYFDGTAWQSYTPGAYVQIPTGGTTLLVRTAIVNDNAVEGQQTLTLTASNTQGTGGAGNTVNATGNIIDNGTGSLFSSTNTTGTPDSPGTNGLPATLNDDRVANPSVNSVTVNEASPFIVFTVSGMPGAGVAITLANDATTGIGHAILGTDTAAASTLEVYRNGSWVAATAATAILDSNGTLLARLAITNDTPAVYEGPETFGITATYNGQGSPATPVTVGGSATGVGTIVDDGTGSVFISSNSTGTPDTSGTGYPSQLDNDKPAFSVADVTVNEADGTMTFTVTLTGATTLPMSVDYASSNGTATLADGDYTAVSGTLNFAAGTTSLTVTVPIANNNIYEGNETLNLNLSNATGGATISDNLGVGTINDAADLPTVGVSDVQVIEANDPYAVVALTLNGQTAQTITFTPSLASTGSATITAGADVDSTTVEYSLDNGVNWSSGQVTIPSGYDPVANPATMIKLRAKIHMNDGQGEATETFRISTGTLTAGSGGGASSITAATGLVSIVDNPTMSISSVVVNEASPYALVQVSFSLPASSAISFTPSLSSSTGTAAVDTGTTIEYLDASNQWQTASTFDGTQWTGGITLPQGATGVLLRTSITHDTSSELSEVVNISTGAATNVLNASGVTGTITILDQGSTAAADVNMFSASATNTTPNVTPANGAVVDPGSLPASQMLLDDDRPLSVDSVTVNENSPWIVFKVRGGVDQYVKLATVDGTGATGASGGTTSPTDGSVDYSTALQYFDGSAWVNYTANTFVKLPGGGTTLMVRTALVQDQPYEGAQTFNLVATNTGGGSTPLTQGVGTIVDDGSGTVFVADDPATPADESVPANNAAPTVTPPTSAVVDPATSAVPLPNDDRVLSVNSVEVNEASPWLIWTVTGKQGQYVKLTLLSETGTLGADTATELQWWNGTQWLDYVPGSFVKMPGADAAATGHLLVRVSVTKDFVFEGPERLKLTATNVGGASTPAEQGIGIIRDDGQGSVFTNGNETGTPDPLGTPGAPAFLDDDRLVPPAPQGMAGSPSETQGRAWVSPWSEFRTHPSLHVLDTVQSSNTWLTAQHGQGMSGDVLSAANGAFALGQSILWSTDALIDSFNRVTDPDLHVQHAVASARMQSNELQLRAFAQQTGLLREPIAEVQAQSVRRHQAQQVAAPSATLMFSDRVSHAVSDGNSGTYDAQVHVNSPSVSAMSPLVEAQKRGDLNFSQQLKLSARARQTRA